MVSDFFSVTFEFQVQKQLTDENPRAVFLGNQVCVLTHPAEACAHGPAFVHGWLNVYADFAFSFGPLLLDP